MPESWWSWCTSQHLRADWKVWKMSCGVELGGLRNRWWNVFAPCLASCKWLWGFPLCSLEKADRTECHCGKRCLSSPEPPHFSSWTSRPSLAKLKCTVPDHSLLHWIKRAQSQPSWLLPQGASILLWIYLMLGWYPQLLPTGFLQLLHQTWIFFFSSPTKCIHSFGFPKNALEALTALLLTASQGRFPRPCSKLCFFSPSGTRKCRGSWDSQLKIDLGDGMIPVACSVCREEAGGALCPVWKLIFDPKIRRCALRRARN